MNRRSFFTRTAQTLAGAITVLKSGTLVPKTESAGYRTYVMGQDAVFTDMRYFDKELVANLRAKDTIFEQMASRRTIPMNMGTTRQIFQYKVKP